MAHIGEKAHNYSPLSHVNVGRYLEYRCNTKEDAPNLTHLLYFFNVASDYSPGLIAPVGQASAQVPQSTHTSGSML